MLKKTIFGFAVVWTILIALLCLAKLNKLPSISISGIDKYVHFTFHFVFTLLWGTYSRMKRNSFELKKIAIIAFTSLCYGVLIELAQAYFTVSRKGDVFDVLANLTGATTAFLCFVLIKKWRQENSISRETGKLN